MNRMTKMTVFAILVTMVAALTLAGCGAPAASPMASPGASAAAQSSAASSAQADPGIEKPKSFGPVAASPKGLGVYGSGELKAGSDKVTVEIDTADLQYVKLGSTVALTNLSDMSHPVMYRGTVTGLPAADAQSKDTCTIEVTLALASPAASPAASSAAPTASAAPDATASGDGGQTSEMGISGTDTLPASDMPVDVTVNRPAKPGVYTVPVNCVQKGKDGLSYVWAVEADTIQQVDPNTMALVKVETGETDGKLVEILSGLTDKTFIIMPFGNQ